MKVALMMLIMVLVSGAQAHSACDINLVAGVNISATEIAFYQNDQPAYRIINDQQLEVAGQRVALNTMQQQLVTRYAQSVRAMVPEVQGMAIEGIDMAIDSVSLVFDDLLGDENKISRQLRSELSGLRADVTHYFSATKTIHFNQSDNGSADFLGKNFETRVERIVETSVQDSIGSLLLAAGKEILASGGDMAAFEQRMNRFGEEVEATMAIRTASLETHAAELCTAAVLIDGLEEQLRRAVPAVQAFNLLQVSSSSSINIGVQPSAI